MYPDILLFPIKFLKSKDVDSYIVIARVSQSKIMAAHIKWQYGLNTLRVFLEDKNSVYLKKLGFRDFALNNSNRCAEGFSKLNVRPESNYPNDVVFGLSCYLEEINLANLGQGVIVFVSPDSNIPSKLALLRDAKGMGNIYLGVNIDTLSIDDNKESVHELLSQEVVLAARCSNFFTGLKDAIDHLGKINAGSLKFVADPLSPFAIKDLSVLINHLEVPLALTHPVRDIELLKSYLAYGVFDIAIFPAHSFSSEFGVIASEMLASYGLGYCMDLTNCTLDEVRAAMLTCLELTNKPQYLIVEEFQINILAGTTEQRVKSVLALLDDGELKVD